MANYETISNNNNNRREEHGIITIIEYIILTFYDFLNSIVIGLIDFDQYIKSNLQYKTKIIILILITILVVLLFKIKLQK
jgi:hypothetical protein